MRSILDMLRAERSARLFFIAHAQSAFGNGVGYVALILVAYDRFPGAWGITLVLLADFLPATLFGTLFGAAADRWSRRTCAVVADVARACAFVGVAFVSGIVPTVSLALLAGVGTALFQPAILAGLPTLLRPDRVPPAMSLFGMLTELGSLLGSSIAALLFLFTDTQTLLLLNGASFAISALVVATLPFAKPSEEEREEGERRPSLFRDATDGLRAMRGYPGVLTIIFAGASALLFGGVLTVVELLYATHAVDAGKSGFSILVALSGVGIVIGNALGSRGGTLNQLRRAYLIGLFAMGAGLLSMAVAPVFIVACLCWVAFGIGNGLVLVYGRMLMQRSAPEHLHGRVYGLWYSTTSGAFAVAFIVAGGLAQTIGVREELAIAGAGGLIVWLATAVVLNRGLEDAPAHQALATDQS